MKRIDLKKVINYAMGAVFSTLGIAILAGWVTLRTGSPGMKNIFGVVLVLYGIYKFTGAVLKTPTSGRDRHFLLILALAGILGLNACSKGNKEPEETVTSGKLTVIVSESHKHLFETEASEFMHYYDQAKVTVVGASTREAVVHLLNDSVRVVVADRKLNAEERGVAQKAGMNIEELLVAEDAFAVLVNKVNNLGIISRETLKGILTGAISRWNQVPSSGLIGPIALVMTGRNSGAYELLKESFFHLQEDMTVSVLEDFQANVLEKTANMANAIGMVSLACYKDTALSAVSPKVKALAFAGIDSATGEQTELKLHQGNVYLGKYPLHYPVYMMRNTKNSLLALGFCTFVASTPGQKVFLNWGLVPKKVPIRLVQLTEDPITQ